MTNTNNDCVPTFWHGELMTRTNSLSCTSRQQLTFRNMFSTFSMLLLISQLPFTKDIVTCHTFITLSSKNLPFFIPLQSSKISNTPSIFSNKKSNVFLFRDINLSPFIICKHSKQIFDGFFPSVILCKINL